MEHTRMAVWAREWIIFALSIGVGGHLAFALVLHDPVQQRWQAIGWNGFLIGLLVYIAVQACRSIFVILRAHQSKRNV